MGEKSGELENAKQSLENFDVEDTAGASAAEETEKSVELEISDDPQEIRGQIEETRRGMSETLDAIQEKLSFSNISEQVKEQVSEQITGAVETLKTTVSDATIGKAGEFMSKLGKEIKKSNITKIASENPLPLILIGLGLGLLAVKKYKSDDSSNYKQFRYQGNSTNEQINRSLNQSTSKDVETGHSVGDSANAAYEGVSSAASSTYQAVSGAAAGAYEKAGDLGGQLKSQYDNHLQKNPLIIGAVALAAGAAVGFSIPTTAYEGNLMGEARENLLSKAGDAARGAYEKVQDVVGQAKDTIGGDVQQAVAQAKDSLTGGEKTGQAPEQPAKPIERTGGNRA